MTDRSHRALAVLVLPLALANAAGAQLNVTGQDRRIDLGANYSSASGFQDQPVFFSSAPDFNSWSDTGSVTAFNSSAGATGSQSSSISPTSISGQGAVSAYATQRLVTDSRDARALSRVKIVFSLASPTQIVFDGAINTATFAFWTGPAKPVTMRFKNLSTNAVLGEVETGYINGPNWEIGAPIHLETTLPAGIYEILGEATQFGVGERPPTGGWSGVGSFSFNLQVVPAPGAGALAAFTLAGFARRRRD